MWQDCAESSPAFIFCSQALFPGVSRVCAREWRCLQASSQRVSHLQRRCRGQCCQGWREPQAAAHRCRGRGDAGRLCHLQSARASALCNLLPSPITGTRTFRLSPLRQDNRPGVSIFSAHGQLLQLPSPCCTTPLRHKSCLGMQATFTAT